MPHTLNYQYTEPMRITNWILKRWTDHFTRKGIPFEVRKVDENNVAIFTGYKPLSAKEFRELGWNVKDEARADKG